MPRHIDRAERIKQIRANIQAMKDRREQFEKTAEISQPAEDRPPRNIPKEGKKPE